MTNTLLRQNLAGKRLGALDYGLKRVGFAVCDELHILASPRGFFANTVAADTSKEADAPALLDAVVSAARSERLAAVIVGVPYRVDGVVTPLMRRIEGSMQTLRTRFAADGLDVVVIATDESFSSKRATETMVASGTKKRKRAEKGRSDAVAAAVMLREFLQELDDN
jgi:putative holliday junction resolvase